MDFSRKVKGMIRSEEYRALFPKTQLDPQAQATDGWYTTEKGAYLPAGVDGGVTGRGAHILSIDDPVKGKSSAESDHQRNVMWGWWDTEAESRLAPGGGVLLTQTRWIDDDLSGRLLAQEIELNREFDEHIEAITQELATPNLPQVQITQLEAELAQAEKRKREEIIHWEVLSLPALANTDEYLTEEGELVETQSPPPKARKLRSKDEALHPDRYDATYYRRKRRTSLPSTWSALYQQNPVPDEGEFFTKDMFQYENLTRADWVTWHIYIAWDLAIGKLAHNDWTVGFVGAYDPYSNLHILNQVRTRTDKLASLILDTSIPYQTQLQDIGIERGQIQMSIMPELKDLIDTYTAPGQDQKLRFPPTFDENLTPVTDKRARAKPAQGMMQQKRVWWPDPQYNPWVTECVSRLLRFPYGAWDDEADALAWLTRMVLSHQPPKRRITQPRQSGYQDKPWRERLATELKGGRGNWMGA